MPITTTTAAPPGGHPHLTTHTPHHHRQRCRHRHRCRTPPQGGGSLRVRRLSPGAGSSRRVRGQGSCHHVVVVGCGRAVRHRSGGWAGAGCQGPCGPDPNARRPEHPYAPGAAGETGLPGACLSSRSRSLSAQTPASRKKRSPDATCPAAVLPWGCGGVGFGCVDGMGSGRGGRSLKGCRGLHRPAGSALFAVPDPGTAP